MVPSISIVMTVYNRERFVGAAIESVLKQTQPDFELLIWDDGSVDRSVEIARHYQQHDARVKVIAATHLGRSLALKAAHAAASGTYLGWVDSDDLLAPTALEETATVLDAHPEVGLVYSDYQVIDESNQLKCYGQRCQIPYSQERLLIDFMTFHFRLFRRDVFEAAGGIDPFFQVAVDYDLCLRLSEVTQVAHLPKPLYYYRYHSQSLSHQQRLAQILASKEAISRALQRRGLSHRYEIEVQIVGQYFLRQKTHASS